MSERNSTIRAVGYYRMSTTKQEASIPEQKEWGASACAKHGIRLVAEFDDPGIPGSEIDSRPGLMKTLEYCERQTETGAAVHRPGVSA